MKRKVLNFVIPTRVLSSIGRDLIKDCRSAVIELVKNSYDADASEVNLKINVNRNDDLSPNSIEIIIEDNGCGMSSETIEGAWMTIATPNKLHMLETPKGRALQGRKGVGRYAAMILGDSLTMVTQTSLKEKTNVSFKWSELLGNLLLKDASINAQISPNTTRQHGTKITIEGDASDASQWDYKTVESLVLDLKRFISPLGKMGFPFSIKIQIEGILNEEQQLDDKFSGKLYELAPLDLIDHYDYRLFSTIDENGNAEVLYENATEKLKQVINYSDQIEDWSLGEVTVDLRVFDREPEAISELLKRMSGTSLKKNEARSLLNEISGVSIYRNGVRVRPYGEKFNDWLSLDKRRVQVPTRHIGNNQIVGVVEIGSESSSSLEDKSARDGLKENTSFSKLKETILSLISDLENKRLIFRKKTGRSRRNKSGTITLAELLDYSSVIEGITSLHNKDKITNESKDAIIKLIEKDKNKREQSAESLQQILVTYERNVTLGKIVKVLMHEGRRPLAYIRQQVPNFEKWIFKLDEEFRGNQLAEKLGNRLERLKDQSLLLSNLFNKVEPLASRSQKKSDVYLSESFNKAIDIFIDVLQKREIEVVNMISSDLSIYGNENDIHTVFVNLIENSIYWIDAKSKGEIICSASVVDNNVVVDIIDNGIGIASKHLEEQLIFEPDFSTKEEGAGTGLGLAIAGDCLDRIGAQISAIECDTGAHFQIIF